MMASQHLPDLSAVSVAISNAGAKTPTQALPREVMHNLQYQHNWTDLRLHTVIPSANPPVLDITSTPLSVLPPPPPGRDQDGLFLISGLPPRHSYIHPDFLNHLIKHDLDEKDVRVQREWVLPMKIGQTWTLQKFCHLFDHLPSREALEGVSGFKHQDAKRVLCGIKSSDGFGGDGTIVYYIMQEGEVKPRQN